MKTKKIFACLLSTLLLLSAFALAEPAERAVYEKKIDDLYARMMADLADSDQAFLVEAYDEPITITCINHYSAFGDVAMSKWGEKYGESYYENRWTDLAKKFNINIQYKWWSADGDYNQKIRLDMASNDLPDIFTVTSQSDLAELARNGMIMDLTDMIDEYAWSRDKEIWGTDGGKLLELATIDGRIYGLPASLPDTDEFSYLWLRKDWLEKLNLEVPTTMDELVSVLQAFKDADMGGNQNTIALGIDSALWYSSRGLFTGFRAYPKYWIEKDGGLVWGGICEENKQALSLLADLYQRGLISHEFITNTYDEMQEGLINGTCGATYAGHWLGHVCGDCHELDPESDWTCVRLPTADGNDVASPLISNGAGWFVVSSKCKNPEAAFKIRFQTTYALNDVEATWWYLEDNVAWNFSPVRSNVSALSNYESYLECLDMYENNDSSVLGGLGFIYWEALNSDLAYEWELMFGPEEDAAMRTLGYAIDNDLLFYDAFMGEQSELMLERWSSIQDEQLIAYTSMITGEVSVEDGFAAWIDTFNKLGGEQITKDVNDWYLNR